MKKTFVLFFAVFFIFMQTAISDADDIDNQLRNKWKLMTSYLKQGDEEKALDLIHPFNRQDYKIIFKALKIQIPQIVSTQVDFQLKEINDNFAKYELTTKEKGNLYSYDVIFSRDREGNWFISEF